MKSIIAYLKRMRAMDTGPGSAFEEYKGLFATYLFGIWVPFAFIFLKLLKIQILPLTYAYDLIVSISTFAPVVLQHWSVLIREDRIADAANYSLFLAVSVIMCLVPIIFFVRVHIRKWRVMLSPHPAGLIWVLISFLIYYLMIVRGIDSASYTLSSAYQLYFDATGLYYFRQYGAVYFYSQGFLFFVLGIVGGAGVLMRKYLRKIQ